MRPRLVPGSPTSRYSRVPRTQRRFSPSSRFPRASPGPAAWCVPRRRGRGRRHPHSLRRPTRFRPHSRASRIGPRVLSHADRRFAAAEPPPAHLATRCVLTAPTRQEGSARCRAQPARLRAVGCSTSSARIDDRLHRYLGCGEAAGRRTRVVSRCRLARSTHPGGRGHHLQAPARDRAAPVRVREELPQVVVTDGPRSCRA